MGKVVSGARHKFSIAWTSSALGNRPGTPPFRLTTAHNRFQGEAVVQNKHRATARLSSTFLPKPDRPDSCVQLFQRRNFNLRSKSFPFRPSANFL